MREVADTIYYSKLLGSLPKGCQYCVNGEKLVLYVTGLCPRHCWYCPLSEKKKDIDVVYANEWKTDKIEEIFEEAELTSAKGAGITGGDPLAKVDRTSQFIRELKNKFGKDFHIHLYTSFVLANQNNLLKLHNAGLDEIRFHPDFLKKEDWVRIDNALKYNWDVGIEIPCIPENEKEILEICDFFDGKIKFLNLNELEVAELNMDEMEKREYETKTDISHGIRGSEELALKVINYCSGKNFSVHFCTSKLKDGVQMTNRFKRRAENVSTDFDVITDEGLLHRGIIYLKNYSDYKSIKRLSDSQRENVLIELKKAAIELEKEGLELIVDDKKLRLLTYPEHVLQFKDELKELGYVPALIEEDPTVEAFEVNRDYL